MVRLIALSILSVLIFGCDKAPERIEVKVPPLEDGASGLTFVEPKPVANGVLLRLNPKATAKVSNALVGRIDVASVPGKPSLPKEGIGVTTISMEYTIGVANANASSVSLSFTSSPLTFEGTARGVWEQRGGQAGEVRFDRRAALLEDPTSLFEGLFGAGMFVFPETAVAPGSTWSSENTRDMPPFGPVRITERFIYKGMETREGTRVHRVDSTATGSLEGMTMSATYYVREDGLPFAASVKTRAATPIATDADGKQVWAGFAVDVEIGPVKK